jgi:hypothetical protein
VFSQTEEVVQIYCPYCGERIELLIDCSVEFQEYIEDCQVCCRPIFLVVSADGAGFPIVEARNENE